MNVNMFWITSDGKFSMWPGIVEDIISCEYGVSFPFCYRILLQLTSLNDRPRISHNL